MKTIKIFPEGTYIKGIDFQSDVQYNLFIDIIPQRINVEEVNILCLFEPDCISGINKHLPQCHQIFDAILTHNQEVVDKYSNATLFTFNSIWATDKKYEKEFTISAVVGNKTWTKHQIMRQELWYSQESIPNKKFFVSSFGGPSDHMGNPTIGANKDELFNSQFHIAIENDVKDHWFSEKILDCFISKTVPIYCGCPNIGSYFNENGIFKFNTIQECISICKSLSDKTYESMLPMIEENYNKAQEYMNWQGRVKDAVASLQINKVLNG
jgi:hypothetical protein